MEMNLECGGRVWWEFLFQEVCGESTKVIVSHNNQSVQGQVLLAGTGVMMWRRGREEKYTTNTFGDLDVARRQLDSRERQKGWEVEDRWR